jgi:hypothetical protein
LQFGICGMCDVQQLALGVAVPLQLVVQVVSLMLDIAQQLFLFFKYPALS